jgi:hypothetical protein
LNISWIPSARAAATIASYWAQFFAGYAFGFDALNLGRLREFGLGAMNDQRIRSRTLVTPRWRSSCIVGPDVVLEHRDLPARRARGRG